MARKRSQLILAIDQGTTGSKALLLDDSLRVVGEASREFPQHFPRPGWVEHDPEEIFRSVRQAVRTVLRQTRTDPHHIAALGITNQRETTVLWERATGRALHNAIVWQDRRTAPECKKLEADGNEAFVRRRTGLVLDPYFSGTKLAWLLRNVSGARGLARRGKLCFGTIDSYLTWRLSGRVSHVTDVSNACRTMLMDLKTCRWSPALCDLLGIDASLLPEILPNDTVFGTTKGVGFLPDGIPIATVVGDQQSALFGQVCFRPGDAKCTYGTGAFLVVNTGDERITSRHGLLATAAWRLGEKTCYALEGSSFVAGAIVQWLRDGLRIIKRSADVEKLAASVEDSGGVTLVPALSGLGAPYWQPEARGLICGLTRGSTDAHIARAALEGIAFQIHDLLRAMELDTKMTIRTLKVDGGATENDLLMRFQADILRRRVIRPRITSTTALGAALLAGLTIGMFPSLSAIQKVWQKDQEFRAEMRPRVARAHLQRWQTAVERTRLESPAPPP